MVLGRSAGISEEKMRHVLADPLPEGVFSDDEAAIVVFACRSTRMEPIDASTWNSLTAHFTTKQIMEIIVTVGFNQMISRFHAAVRTDVDGWILDAVSESCPVRLPPPPTG